MKRKALMTKEVAVSMINSYLKKNKGVMPNEINKFIYQSILDKNTILTLTLKDLICIAYDLKEEKQKCTL